MGNYNENNKESAMYNEIYEKTGNCNETEKESDKYSDRLAIDLSEKIFLLALAQSDNTFFRSCMLEIIAKFAIIHKKIIKSNFSFCKNIFF